MLHDRSQCAELIKSTRKCDESYSGMHDTRLDPVLTVLRKLLILLWISLSSAMLLQCSHIPKPSEECEALRDASLKNRKAIVFVHGFMGTCKETWDKFPNLIHTDEALTPFDVYSWGYPSGVFSKQPSARRVGQQLKTYLANNLSEYDEIYLVSHSLGGLVVQYMVIDELQKGHASQLTRIKHIVFFGSPLNGHELDRLTRLVKNEYADIDFRSESITALVTEWNERVYKPDIRPGDENSKLKIRFTPICGLEDEFITPNECTAIYDRFVETVPGNHFEMKNPRNRDADSYRIVKRRLVESTVLKGDQPIVPPDQENKPKIAIISKPSGNLRAPRSGHMSVKLPDGRVLVTGGFNENAWVASFELFDPKTQEFSLLQGVRLEEGRHKAAWIRDGQVVFAGSGMARANLMFLDINTKPPTIAHSKTETLWQHYNDTFSFMQLPDGRLFIAGAPTSNGDRKVEFYDLIKDEFIAGQDLLFSRFGGQTATLRRDNSILILGGVGRDARRAEIYSPDGTTRQSGILGQQRRQHTATLLETGKPGNVVVIGGLSNRSEGAVASNDVPVGFVEIHDASTGYFDRIEDKLEVPRFDHTSTLLPDGTVLIVGGFTKNGRWNNSTDIVERFHPRRQKLETIGRLHTARGKHTAELLDDGSVLIVGGVLSSNGQTIYLNSAEILGPF